MEGGGYWHFSTTSEVKQIATEVQCTYMVLQIQNLDFAQSGPFISYDHIPVISYDILLHILYFGKECQIKECDFFHIVF